MPSTARGSLADCVARRLDAEALSPTAAPAPMPRCPRKVRRSTAEPRRRWLRRALSVGDGRRRSWSGGGSWAGFAHREYPFEVGRGGDCAPEEAPGEAARRSLRAASGGRQRPSLFVLVIGAGFRGPPGLGGRGVADFAPRPRRRDPRLRRRRRDRGCRPEQSRVESRSGASGSRGPRSGPSARRGRRATVRPERPGFSRHASAQGRRESVAATVSRGRPAGSSLGSAGRSRGRRRERPVRHEDLRGPRRRRHDPRDGVLRRGARRKGRERGSGRSEREERRPASGTVHRRLPCCPRSLSGERPTKEKALRPAAWERLEREKGAKPGAGQSL